MRSAERRTAGRVVVGRELVDMGDSPSAVEGGNWEEKEAVVLAVWVDVVLDQRLFQGH